MREECLHSLARAASRSGLLENEQAAGWEKLRSVACMPGYEIGSHSVSHRQLSALNAEEQEFEIQGSRQRLQQRFGHEVNAFAIPHGGEGDFTPQTTRLIRQAGYRQCFIYGQRPVGNHPDLYNIPRLNVPDWGAEQFRSYLLEIFSRK